MAINANECMPLVSIATHIPTHTPTYAHTYNTYFYVNTSGLIIRLLGLICDIKLYMYVYLQ